MGEQSPCDTHFVSGPRCVLFWPWVSQACLTIHVSHPVSWSAVTSSMRFPVGSTVVLGSSSPAVFFFYLAHPLSKYALQTVPDQMRRGTVDEDRPAG